MRKDIVSIGRGGSAVWVDVQVVTTAKVSREHLRLRGDASGQFFVQDVSLWGTTVDGVADPAGASRAPRAWPNPAPSSRCRRRRASAWPMRSAIDFEAGRHELAAPSLFLVSLVSAVAWIGWLARMFDRG